MPSTHHDLRLASQNPGDRQLLKGHSKNKEKALVVRGKNNDIRNNTNDEGSWANLFLENIKQRAGIQEGLRIDFKNHLDRPHPKRPD